jgi:hypothetical protein
MDCSMQAAGKGKGWQKETKLVGLLCGSLAGMGFQFRGMTKRSGNFVCLSRLGRPFHVAFAANGILLGILGARDETLLCA